MEKFTPPDFWGFEVKKRKLTRDEKKARRDLEKSFQAEFKKQSKAAGWSYLKPTAFKRMGEWFVGLNPIIWTDAKRAQLQVTVKPYDLDDLMSRILGFGGLDGSPLSLRTRGPHALVVPIWSHNIESEGDLDKMLSNSTEFIDEVPSKLATLSLDDFIKFVATGGPANSVSYNHVAALILAKHPGEAHALCQQAIASKQWGGPARMTESGQIIGFFELTKQWLEEHEQT